MSSLTSLFEWESASGDPMLGRPTSPVPPPTYENREPKARGRRSLHLCLSHRTLFLNLLCWNFLVSVTSEHLRPLRNHREKYMTSRWEHGQEATLMEYSYHACPYLCTLEPARVALGTRDIEVS